MNVVVSKTCCLTNSKEKNQSFQGQCEFFLKIKKLFCVPCPSRLARLQAPPSLSLLPSSFLSSACDERISCEDDFRAGMEVRVLFEGENRIAAERKERASQERKAEKATGEAVFTHNETPKLSLQN